MKQAKDLMAKDFVYLNPEDSIFEAAKIFSDLDAHGLPVVKDEKLLGVISISDIIKFIDLQIDSLPELKGASIPDVILTIFKTLKSSDIFEKEMEKISTTKVEDIMTKDVVAVGKSTSFIEIAKIMNEKNIHRLPVVCRGKIVGMITGIDLVKVLIEKPKKSKKK